MIEQGLFKRHFVGRDGFHWWIGQIPDAKTWRMNLGGKRVANNTEVEGFGQRYKVRIMGYHTAVASELPDEDLPWASVMYPVTAGSGNNGSSQSVNILQGDFVYGFFLDGEDGQQPVIMGVIGNNDYQGVMKNIPDAKFVPFSGIDPAVPDNALIPAGTRKEGGAGEYVQQAGAQNEEVANTDQINSATVGLTDQDKATTDADDNLESALQPLAQSTNCEPLPIGRIQSQLQNILQEIEKLRKTVYDIGRGGKEAIADVQRRIDNLIEKGAEFIAGGIKWVYEQVEQFIEQKVNEGFKLVYDLALPNERELVNTTSGTILETMKCFFRKLFSQLKEMVMGFLKDSVNKVINVPVCFVEGFVGGVLGSLSGTISGALSGIQDLIGSAVDIAGAGLDLASDAIGLVEDVLSFLTCDDRPECSGVNDWNPRSGAAKLSVGDFQNIADKAKSFVKTPTTFGTEALDQFGNLTDIDLSSAFNFDDCNTDPELLGPPVLEIFGDDGIGAAGNLVIGAAGEVLSVDITSFGAGYTGKAKARVNDKSGKGKGAVVKPVFGPVPRSGRSKDDSGPDERTVVGKRVEATIRASKRRAKVGTKIKIQWNVRNANKISASKNLGKIGSKKFEGEVEVVVKKGFNKYRIIGFNRGDRVTTEVRVEGTIGEPRKINNSPYGPGNYRPSNSSGVGQLENPDFPSTPGLLYPARSGGGGGAAPLGFGPFDPNPYPFPANPADNVYAPQPFNPSGEIFSTPIYGLGPSFFETSPLLVTGTEGVTAGITSLGFERELVPVEFTITRSAALNNRITFLLDDVEKNFGLGELNFSFTGNDVGKEIRYISPNKDYFVRAYHPDGSSYPFPVADNPEANPDPFRIDNNGTTIRLDDVYGRVEREVVDVYERTVRDAVGEADIIWEFGGLPEGAEQAKYLADPAGYIKKNLIIKDGNRTIEIDDNPSNGFDRNATFKIVSGNGRFSDDGLKVIGSGTIGIELEWDDNIKTSGQAIKSIGITGAGVNHNGKDVTWSQTDNGKPDGEKVEEGKDFESFQISAVDRVIREEVKRIEKEGGKSDFDYTDLVIEADKGKFKLKKSVAGLAIYRYEPETSSGPQNPSPNTIGEPGQPEGPGSGPAINTPLAPDLPGGDDIGIVDFVIDDPGTGYKGNYDGSRGGDGRTWSEPDDTIVKHEDGTWEIPIPPDNPFCFLPGDIVILPAGTVVVTEPRDGKGGGETIIGGSPHVIQVPGCITTPTPPPNLPPAKEPTGGNGEYPVILYLCEIIVKNRGFGYLPGDKVIIDPSNGATAEATFDNFGRVIEIKITNGGEGFKVMPNIYIESKTGSNALLIGKLCIDRDGPQDPDDNDKVITVIDCVGLDAVGNVDGKPYYGPYHEHNGQKMVGAEHSDKPHKFIDGTGGAGGDGGGSTLQFITQEQVQQFIENPNTQQ